MTTLSASYRINSPSIVGPGSQVFSQKLSERPELRVVVSAQDVMGRTRAPPFRMGLREHCAVATLDQRAEAESDGCQSSVAHFLKET